MGSPWLPTQDSKSWCWLSRGAAGCGRAFSKNALVRDSDAVLDALTLTVFDDRQNFAELSRLLRPLAILTSHERVVVELQTGRTALQFWTFDADVHVRSDVPAGVRRRAHGVELKPAGRVGFCPPLEPPG